MVTLLVYQYEKLLYIRNNDFGRTLIYSINMRICQSVQFSGLKQISKILYMRSVNFKYLDFTR